MAIWWHIKVLLPVHRLCYQSNSLVKLMFVETHAGGTLVVLLEWFWCCSIGGVSFVGSGGVTVAVLGLYYNKSTSSFRIKLHVLCSAGRRRLLNSDWEWYRERKKQNKRPKKIKWIL